MKIKWITIGAFLFLILLAAFLAFGNQSDTVAIGLSGLAVTAAILSLHEKS